MSGVIPGQFLGCFLGTSWYVSPNLFAYGAGSHTSLYAAVTALAADLDKKVVRRGGQLGSKEIAFLCICLVFTGAAGRASSGRLGFLKNSVGLDFAALCLSAAECTARA